MQPGIRSAHSAGIKIVLRSRDCVSTLFMCAKFMSLNYYATVATSTVEANGSLQAKQAKVCLSSVLPRQQKSGTCR